MSRNKLHTRSLNRSAGFSLTELLVVIVMFGMITAATYSLFREQGRISRAQQSILDMQSNGRAAVSLLKQSFSHAGFGSSDTNPTFLTITNSNPDVATVRYAHKHVGNVTTTIPTTPTNKINYSLKSGQSISNGDAVSIYPSLSPNTTYTVNDDGPPLEVSTSVAVIPKGAKIFQVFPVKFYLDAVDDILYLEDSDGKTPVAFNVAAFEATYMEQGSTDWTESPSSTSNPQAAYIYFILRTEEKEPGFKQANIFSLPWTNSTTPSITIEDGYHYQSFETIVWIRNAK